MKVSSAAMTSLSNPDLETVDVTEGEDGCENLHLLFRDGMSIVNYTYEGKRISHAMPTKSVYLFYSD